MKCDLNLFILRTHTIIFMNVETSREAEGTWFNPETPCYAPAKVRGCFHLQTKRPTAEFPVPKYIL